MKFKKEIIFMFIILLSLITKADLVPSFIIDDLSHEIFEADYIQLSQSERESLVKELKSITPVEDDKLKAFLDLHFSTIISRYLKQGLAQYIHVTRQNKITNIYPADINEQQQHALVEIEDYTKNRIGHGTYNFITNQKAKVFIVGGDNKFIHKYVAQIAKAGDYKLLKIPSLYEAWGISKYYLPKQVGLNEPVIIWIVPPAIRYVRHYSTLFNVFTHSKAIAFVDEQSIKEYAALAKANVNKVSKDNQIDYVAFGYEKVWLKELKKNPSIIILETKEFSNLNLGARITFIKIKNKFTNNEVCIALFSSNLTVWGELAALHLKAFLTPKLKGVIFLGSAGSVDKNINPYDVSIPEKFVRPGSYSGIDNFLNQTEVDTDVVIHQHSKHGNTFSPIEQSKKYLRSVIENKISTIDVEQTLVAEEVQRFNELNQTQIQFGAVNVVTDKPYSVILGESSENDLDRLNYEKKQQAREVSVAIALKAVLKNESFDGQLSCKTLFK